MVYSFGLVGKFLHLYVFFAHGKEGGCDAEIRGNN